MRVIVETSRRTSPTRLFPLVLALALAVVVGCGQFAATQFGGSSDGDSGGDGPQQRRQRRRAARVLEEELCESAPAVDTKLLHRWQCKLLQDACLDEGRILIHTGQKTPLHSNWTGEKLFKPGRFPPYTLPGYAEPLGTAQYLPTAFDIDIRGPTALDPEDVREPTKFNNCTVPLLFWPWYFSVYGDFFVLRLASLSRMREEGLFDDNVKFVPESNGMEAPRFYQTHLEPFSRNPVETLASLSSRENIHLGRSRCYRQLLLCNISFYGHTKEAARKVINYYKERQPEKFVPVNDSIFRVAFFKRTTGSRVLLNQAEVMQKCKQWQLPTGTRFTEVDCYMIDDFGPDNLVDSLAQLQRVNALVSMHGSGMTNAFFLPTNASVIEIICWNFCGSWPDFYYRWQMEDDQSIRSGYIRLRADKEHCYPGLYERQKLGVYWAYKRDQDIRVTFSALAKALEKVARGEIFSVRANFDNRTIPMLRNDPVKCT